MASRKSQRLAYRVGVSDLNRLSLLSILHLLAGFTIAMMPARTVSDNVVHAATTTANSDDDGVAAHGMVVAISAR